MSVTKHGQKKIQWKLRGTKTGYQYPSKYLLLCSVKESLTGLESMRVSILILEWTIPA